jgi:transketolase
MKRNLKVPTDRHSSARPVFVSFEHKRVKASQVDVTFLEKKAKAIRRMILEMIVSSGKGHIGGALSCTDILTTLYYGNILRLDPKNVGWPDRDRFILSKGHSCAALYSVLADQGFFPRDELASASKKGSMLGGHPDRNIPGVECDTGSLGHGLGIGSGLALAGKMDGKDFKTIVLLGDGECYEGSVWEAAQFSGSHGLNNLLAIVDRNRQCVNDFTEDINRLDPLADKWQAFGWDAVTIDGHSCGAVLQELREFQRGRSSKPLAIIAETIKGKGISFMEGKLEWHHGMPSPEELEIARRELTLDFDS